MNKIIKTTGIFCSTLLMVTGFVTPKAKAYGVCGLKTPEAQFKTAKHLVTICPGEASFQMIITYHDGSGYKRMAATRRGDRFSGSDAQHNYIIDSKRFIIGTDGKEPIRENVIQAQM
ncbi:hypothetical protein QUB80_07835 [Chlorogloeopsis sp. ULAP01]|uniref:hypothetical protein n=1 Tax=Chlorogloeopsis sp. ULAP01 TaxID=3056483 RepID=UPI0025AA8355|nr:hypothetical protein [Chlorogloeopsis sp. ULAP01]MDM9380615.1 hypothetical protein [Chlorogloeopsis sp. ULAP01]